ncbi:OLC1v1032146C1 [Oldenlandia corymbosa var. corymbosa]|uniref:OLC1v1032146C1 n=1 Tax=Oldenlandia corymbosa var. corymbosa TaxID=529605 RepID=A0AAV1CM74_OLDCO|nr:OLC1v1032146C1 [Oldenlandia corymbosa var. corymbosa]
MKKKAWKKSCSNKSSLPLALLLLLLCLGANILVVPSSAEAQGLSLVSLLPPCSIPCLEESIKRVTACGTTDLQCWTREDNMRKVRVDAAGCVIGACGAETQKVISSLQRLLNKVTTATPPPPPPPQA